MPMDTAFIAVNDLLVASITFALISPGCARIFHVSGSFARQKHVEWRFPNCRPKRCASTDKCIFKRSEPFAANRFLTDLTPRLSGISAIYIRPEAPRKPFVQVRCTRIMGGRRPHIFEHAIEIGGICLAVLLFFYVSPSRLLVVSILL